ncbi:hypothetical protein C8J57DRAFT_1226134 [Mycena rebaudengoi]|nr:hypothetical protein C8J57DRAFT_1226134 [Mycena rebaudengoi]
MTTTPTSCRIFDQPNTGDVHNYPPPEIVTAFWRRVADLTTRTRAKGGKWVGSEEVFQWNAKNMMACDKCTFRRNPKQCTLEDDQASCLPCRQSKMSCDRKMRFLFDSTRQDFFSSYDLFLQVVDAKDQKQCRTFKKTANKRRQADKVKERSVAIVRQKAIRLNNSDRVGSSYTVQQLTLFILRWRRLPDCRKRLRIWRDETRNFHK